MKEKIAKFREYLDYVERHYDNVQKAWKVIQEKCKDMSFIRDEATFWALNHDIEHHDISKLDKEEFFAYRSYFYPTKLEIPNKAEFKEAWDHHLQNNDHHWQNWTKVYQEKSALPEICLVHNIVDWMAMGYEFNDTAQEYYESNKHKIDLPKWAITLMYKIFDRVYGKD